VSDVSELRLGPAGRVAGEVTVPGDKSISHRALILGVLARGRSFLGNLSPAADVASTAACLGACGAWVRRFAEDRVVLDGDGVGRSLRSPEQVLDCGNSGTTMRLLSGVLAGHPVEATLDGDASLRRRPMRRVAVPLERMGAGVQPTPEGTAPIRVRGRHPLRAIEYELPVASAQLKSAVLLAGLSADGLTTVVEPASTRDHTERLLRLCGVEVESCAGRVTVVPAPLQPFGLRIPGDLSSAAFLLALAASRPGWWVRCPGVTLNPGRTGILDVLEEMGAAVAVEALSPAGGVEPVGAVEVHGAPLRAVTVGGAVVPRVIDELPVLAVLATQAEGTTEIRDAAELRAKESDRIAAVAAGLRALGAECEEASDGLAIQGPVRLHPAILDSQGDHRLAMAWAVAGCLASGDGLTTIRGAGCVGVSYPRFFDDLARVTGGTAVGR
jgi:3-phosphoshikimate 1-carboxyvinyltransferase